MTIGLRGERPAPDSSDPCQLQPTTSAIVPVSTLPCGSPCPKSFVKRTEKQTLMDRGCTLRQAREILTETVLKHGHGDMPRFRQTPWCLWHSIFSTLFEIAYLCVFQAPFTMQSFPFWRRWCEEGKKKFTRLPPAASDEVQHQHELAALGFWDPLGINLRLSLHSGVQCWAV